MSKQDFSKWSQAELILEIEKLQSQKKFGLVWEAQDDEESQLLSRNFPVIKEIASRKIIKDDSSCTNILIEGDNLHALSILNFTHSEAIDVIFIDPPYNTGSNTWIYNNRIVDSNDTYRHSKWLTFMRSRLELARNLLKEDGLICVSIDDYELFTLGLLMDEIFGEQNRAAIITVENNPRGRTSSRYYATSHEFYLIYAKDAKLAKAYDVPLTEDQKAVFKLEDEISNYRLKPLRKSGADSRRKDRPKQFYPIYVDPKTLRGSLDAKPGWEEALPIDDTGAERVWIIGTDKCREFLEDGTIVITKAKGSKTGYAFAVKDRIKSGRKLRSVWVDPRYDTSSHGATLLLKMFGKKVFDYPKSLWAVRDFLVTALGDKKNPIILDFFAGSGTTGHAVLQLIKEDGKPRQFILCTNNENQIAENVTYERIKKVIDGYGSTADASHKGIEANLRYFKVGLVANATTDANKKKLSREAVNMLCLKENAFNEVIDDDVLKVFSNNLGFVAILLDFDKLFELHKVLSDNPEIKFKVYVFSLSSDNFSEEFETYGARVESIPVPEGILNTYFRTLNQLKR